MYHSNRAIGMWLPQGHWSTYATIMSFLCQIGSQRICYMAYWGLEQSLFLPFGMEFFILVQNPYYGVCDLFL